jgi:hypothetical protein
MEQKHVSKQMGLFQNIFQYLALVHNVPNSSSYLHSANKTNGLCFKGDRDIKGEGEGDI